MLRIRRNIRSESILFFPRNIIDDDTLTTGGRIRVLFDFDHPYLVGFHSARSDDISPSGAGAHDQMGYGPDPAEQAAARNLTMDYYQHPAKLSDPNLPYERFYDLYSLGVVLLELGGWGTIVEKMHPGSPYDMAERIRNLVTGAKLNR